MVTPANGVAAALQERFDNAASQTSVAEVFQFPRVEPTAARQLRTQKAILEANIAERLARGESIDAKHQPFVQPDEVVMGQIRIQSDQSIFSSAFLHIPR